MATPFDRACKKVLRPLRLESAAIERLDDDQCIRQWSRIANTVLLAASHHGIHYGPDESIKKTAVSSDVCNAMSLQFAAIRRRFPDRLPEVVGRMYRYAAARVADRAAGRTSASQPMHE